MAITQLHQQRLQDQTINSSMARQAVINGNFDVWQRGVTSALTDITVTHLADRWADLPSRDTGTLPTLTRSRQTLTSGELANSYYFTRLNTNGAGSGFGANAIHLYWNKIEHGTRLLCGAGKKVTISFWARSSITNKKLGLYLTQSYGTGGSPTSAESITGTNYTLTSSWVKYTYTITTNTLVGKTFGTNNDDFIEPSFVPMWGTAYSGIVGSGSAETYVGSGNIDIAQVQLCAGSEALPFEPKSYGQELADCQRYCFTITTPANVGMSNYGVATNTTTAYPWIELPVPFRVPPIEFTVTPSDWVLADGASSIDCTNIIVSGYDQLINPTRVQLGCTVASGLTQFRMYDLASDATGNRKMIFGSEL